MSMGYTEYMDPKRGNASPGPGHSLTGPPRGQMSLKSSPFCPRSSSRLTQCIIQDHMVSHYKKVYSAKAAIDSSVPKSMLSSVKYNDQLRREQLRKDASRSDRRPQSAGSHSQRSSRANTKASCPSQNTQSGAGQESAYFYLGSSMISTPRINTSFHAKQIVYPSQMVGGSGSPPHFFHCASEYSYRSPNSQRQQPARSTTGTQSGYKAFQDPVQKTYSGDLIQKHAHRFTQDKPFTPRTLKSDSRSYLSQYRYYTPPRGKPAQDQERTIPRLTRQETYHGSTRTKECSSPEWDDQPLGHGTEHEWSDADDESHTLNLSAFGQRSKGNKSVSSDHFHPSFRVSPEGMTSPIMKRVSAEEEEFMYLEFIADVTNEILSRGLYSDRVLERVFERHVDKNKHLLDEDKMCHLLETLRNDLQSPANTPTFSAEPKNGEETELDLLHSRLQGLDSLDRGALSETKEDNDLFPYALFNQDSGGLENVVPLSVSTPLYGSPPKRTDSDSLPVGSPDADGGAEGLDEHNHDRENDFPPSLGENTPLTLEEDHNQNLEDNYGGLSKDLEDLESNLSESLHVSNAPNSAGPVVTENINTVASFSDDEF
ncbi:spermatogenesis-associated protein 7 homolog isoform X1 [Oncorhynchus keta]|uniref:spermatogenesis-associated protein 7 homolog isoform X1 n=3 Tax=Oncorhynchus keta TaxID=8018 RepID=UPI0015FC1621|nr:spermatogenesis-associated protein 7 homolog isoform X1 [Oncorhynchus keta]